MPLPMNHRMTFLTNASAICEKKTWIIVDKLQYVHSKGVARLFPFPKPLVCIIGKINLVSGFRAYGYFWVEIFHNYSPKRRSLPHLLPQLPTSRSPQGFFGGISQLLQWQTLKESRPWTTENPEDFNRRKAIYQSIPESWVNFARGTFSTDKTKPRLVCPLGGWSLTHRGNLALKKSKNQVYPRF